MMGWVAALGITLLWLSHWGAYVGKALALGNQVALERREFFREVLGYAISGLLLSLAFPRSASAQQQEPRCPPGQQQCYAGYINRHQRISGRTQCVSYNPKRKGAYEGACREAQTRAMDSLDQEARAAAKQWCGNQPCTAQHARCTPHIHRLEDVRCEIRAGYNQQNRRYECCAICSAQVWVLCCCQVR
ncbi:MAG: hypothetical protein RMJ19_01720 [Gemmatales bacterium]|nr:hypothetical protein [Gemmatales bacterium]MDW8174364.1 hypothetical protein [Gemmatales bacterium]